MDLAAVAIRWMHADTQLDALPRELAVALQQAGLREVQGLVKVIKQAIKDRAVQPSAKVRALKLLALAMETGNTMLSSTVAKKFLRRLKLLAIQGGKEPLFSPGNAQEASVSTSFHRLLLCTLRDWSESSHLTDRDKQPYQDACRQILSAGVSLPKRSPISRELTEYRESGTTLMRLLSLRDVDALIVHEAAEVVRNVLAVLQAEIEVRIESDLSAEVLLEIYDYLQQTLQAYQSWVPTGDPQLPPQREEGRTEWAVPMTEPRSLGAVPEEEDELDVLLNEFQQSAFIDPPSFFVLPTQNFDDPIEDDITRDKLSSLVLPTQRDKSQQLARKHELLINQLAEQEETLILTNHKLTDLRRESQDKNLEKDQLKTKFEEMKKMFQENKEKITALQGSIGLNMQTSTGDDEESSVISEKQTKLTEISHLKQDISQLKEKLRNFDQLRKNIRKKEEELEGLRRKMKGGGSVKGELAQCKATIERLKQSVIAVIDLNTLKSDKENLQKQVKTAKLSIDSQKNTLNSLLSHQSKLHSQEIEAKKRLFEVIFPQTKSLLQSIQSGSRLNSLLPTRSFHVPVSSIAQQVAMSMNTEESEEVQREVGNLKEWEECLGLNGGEMYVSWDLKVRFWSVIWGLEVRMVLEVNRVGREKVEGVRIDPVPCEEVSMEITPFQGCQMNWLCRICCYKAFSESPIISLQYSLHSAKRSLFLRLPVTVVDFLQPCKSLPDPQSVWSNLSECESRVTLTGLSAVSREDVVELLKYHGVMEVGTYQETGEQGAVGVGVFQRKLALVRIWRKDEDCWLMAIRCASAKLRAALKQCLTCQFSFYH